MVSVAGSTATPMTVAIGPAGRVATLIVAVTVYVAAEAAGAVTAAAARGSTRADTTTAHRGLSRGAPPDTRAALRLRPAEPFQPVTRTMAVTLRATAHTGTDFLLDAGSVLPVHITGWRT